MQVGVLAEVGGHADNICAPIGCQPPAHDRTVRGVTLTFAAIEAIIADVFRRGFWFRWCSSIVSLALRRIKRRQRLLPFVWIRRG